MRTSFITLSLLLGTSVGYTQSAEPVRAMVSLRALATPSGEHASTVGSVELSGVVRFHVEAGTSGNGANLCTLGIGGLVDEKDVRTLLNDAGLVWALGVEFLAFEGDSFEVAVASRRYRRGERGGVAKEKEIRRRVRLTRGEPYYVDFFAEANPVERDGCAAQNLLIELRVAPPVDRSDLEFREDVLRYEGWLVHEDIEGGGTTSHFAALGKHGETVRFRFEPLRQRLGPGPASSFDVVTEVSGSVQGRKRPDGDIDLVLRADEISMIVDERGLKLPSGAGGEKKLTVHPGEVVRIELPHPTGRSVHRLPPESGGQRGLSLQDVRSLGDGSAITIGDGVVVVELEELYRGFRTSLTLSVTPLE